MTKPQNIQKEKRTMHIDCRLTPSEYKQIKHKAASTGYSASEYIRRVSMNYPLRSLVDQVLVAELIRCRADTGRIAGLFKMWQTNNEKSKPNLGRYSYQEINNIVSKLLAEQEKLMQTAEKIMKEKKRS